MAITIFYKIRLAKSADVDPFLAAAASEAKKRKWKVSQIASEPRGSGQSVTSVSGIEITPHAKCESIRFEFSKKLACDELVKTGHAPLKTHIAVVEFLRALKPLAKSMKVEDEGEYWATGDEAALKRHRDGFDEAFGRKPLQHGRELIITLGAMVGVTNADGSTKFVPGERREVSVPAAPLTIKRSPRRTKPRAK